MGARNADPWICPIRFGRTRRDWDCDRPPIRSGRQSAPPRDRGGHQARLRTGGRGIYRRRRRGPWRALRQSVNDTSRKNLNRPCQELGARSAGPLVQALAELAGNKNAGELVSTMRDEDPQAVAVKVKATETAAM